MEAKYREYVIQHFATVYNLPDEIRAELETGKSKVTWPEDDFNFETGKSFNPPHKVFKYGEAKIPFLFAEGDELSNSNSKGVQLGFDWIAASFFFLSGFQEWYSTKRSSRFKSRDAIQYRMQAHRLPLVNYYFQVVKEALEKAYNVKIAHRSKRPTLFLSHNVLKLKSGWIHGGWSETKKFRLHYAIQLLVMRLVGRDDWYNLNRIMDMEEGMQVHSTFFIHPRKQKGGADFDIRKPKYHKWVKQLQGRQFEVGILSSKASHVSAKAMGGDLRRIKNRVFGNRFNDLVIRPEKSYRALEKNKVKYDSSFTFFDEVGFRNAYCFPFRLWNFEEDRPAEFLEIPVHILDSSLVKQKFLYSRKDEAIVIIYDFLKEVAKFKGMLGINWHTHYFSDFKYNGWRNVYAEGIKRAHEMDFKSKTGYLIYEEFLKRGL